MPQVLALPCCAWRAGVAQGVQFSQFCSPYILSQSPLDINTRSSVHSTTLASQEWTDPWLAPDKAQHFALCFAVTAAAYLISRSREPLRKHRLLIGCCAGVAAGVFKEVGDVLQVTACTMLRVLERGAAALKWHVVLGVQGMCRRCQHHCRAFLHAFRLAASIGLSRSTTQLLLVSLVCTAVVAGGAIYSRPGGRRGGSGGGAGGAGGSRGTWLASLEFAPGRARPHLTAAAAAAAA